MLINWYPGHMEKARKKVKDIMPQIDVVIEVIDARLPASSSNPMIEKLRGDKPVLKLLSKSDLADNAITQAWLAHFKAERNTDAIAISTQKPGLIRSLPDRILALASKKARIKPVEALILGIPNVGKSTLINSLVGRKAVAVGNEPAITKAQQKIVLNSQLTLIDSPGMTWPGSKNVMVNYRLAASGAIRDTALSYDDVGYFAVDYLLQRYPEALAEAYGVPPLPDEAAAAMTVIANKRGCMQSGRVDFVRVGELIVRDLRAGKLGHLSLEEPHISYCLRDG
jgi:ribosome biogenesis GTPase A